VESNIITTKTAILDIDKSSAKLINKKITYKICKDTELEGFKYKYDYLKDKKKAQFIFCGSEDKVEEYINIIED